MDVRMWDPRGKRVGLEEYGAKGAVKEGKGGFYCWNLSKKSGREGRRCCFVLCVGGGGGEDLEENVVRGLVLIDDKDDGWRCEGFEEEGMGLEPEVVVEEWEREWVWVLVWEDVVDIVFVLF